MKICTKCGIEKSLDDFHYDERGPQERRSECKECRSKRNKIYFSRYYEKNRESILKKQAEDYRRRKGA